MYWLHAWSQYVFSTWKQVTSDKHASCGEASRIPWLHSHMRAELIVGYSVMSVHRVKGQVALQTEGVWGNGVRISCWKVLSLSRWQPASGPHGLIPGEFRGKVLAVKDYHRRQRIPWRRDTCQYSHLKWIHSCASGHLQPLPSRAMLERHPSLVENLTGYPVMKGWICNIVLQSCAPNCQSAQGHMLVVHFALNPWSTASLLETVLMSLASPGYLFVYRYHSSLKEECKLPELQCEIVELPKTSFIFPVRSPTSALATGIIVWQDMTSKSEGLMVVSDQWWHTLCQMKTEAGNKVLWRQETIEVRVFLYFTYANLKWWNSTVTVPLLPDILLMIPESGYTVPWTIGNYLSTLQLSGSIVRQLSSGSMIAIQIIGMLRAVRKC